MQAALAKASPTDIAQLSEQAMQLQMADGLFPGREHVVLRRPPSSMTMADLFAPVPVASEFQCRRPDGELEPRTAKCARGCLYAVGLCRELEFIERLGLLNQLVCLDRHRACPHANAWRLRGREGGWSRRGRGRPPHINRSPCKSFLTSNKFCAPAAARLRITSYGIRFPRPPPRHPLASGR